MTNQDKDFNQFAENFQQEILSRVEVEGNEKFLGDQFTEVALEYLIDSGEIEEATVCFHKTRGLQVNGYSLSDDEIHLNLYISICDFVSTPGTIYKNQIETAFKLLSVFLQKSLDKYYLSLEEASPVFDFALRIYEARKNIRQIRFFLLTDGLSNIEAIPEIQMSGYTITRHIWDMRRLYRLWSSGSQREVIEVDFSQMPDGPVPCLPIPGENAEYDVYLAMLPGRTIVNLYEYWGTRLLEKNVRSFLQVRGKINKGIRESILKEPHMFLAYNNGLSVTAKSVRITDLKNGGKGIMSAADFQIVNGGQTTASIFHAVHKDKADVSEVFVQAKITVPKDPAKIDEFVPKISKYANSQNKVSDADFSANDPFHISVEELSRTVWAPALENMQRNTRWYYERARGQYLDDKNREKTAAKKTAFTNTHPLNQKFTKTDLAKFENSWDLRPFMVSRGAEKNFFDFTIRIKEKRGNGGIKADQQYFQRLIAKAILFRHAEKIVQLQHYGGYKANIVTYTLSWLYYKTAQRINLDEIWRTQSLPEEIREAIILISKQIHSHIINSSSGKNVTEWCKKEECWTRLMDINIDFPASIRQYLLANHQSDDQTSLNSGTEFSPVEQNLIDGIGKVPGDVFLKISGWAKETNNLTLWQRRFSYDLGCKLKRGASLSPKQATQAQKILNECDRLGFSRLADT